MDGPGLGAEAPAAIAQRIGDGESAPGGFLDGEFHMNRVAQGERPPIVALGVDHRTDEVPLGQLVGKSDAARGHEGREGFVGQAQIAREEQHAARVGIAQRDSGFVGEEDVFHGP